MSEKELPTDDHHDGNDAEHGHGDGDHEHHGGVRQYVMIFFALCGLTLASTIVGLVATKTDLLPPQVAWIAMMGISCLKALLVMMFFMHLLWEANWKYVLTIPASVMSVFLVLMLVPDVNA